ncbi:prepilin-type N-terminal cleavage/methylation domain-containing protein [Pseudomonas sp.]|uniref:type IV pilus modification PilV family protein n=1 Tax=Pseudomonas sp. TaxID=306 RepID=UPI00356AE128
MTSRLPGKLNVRKLSLAAGNAPSIAGDTQNRRAVAAFRTVRPAHEIQQDDSVGFGGSAPTSDSPPIAIASRPAGKRPRQAGFTLLEVLVAFVILALVMGVLTRILSLSMRSLETAGHYQQALQLAESQLAEVGARLTARRSEHLQGRLQPPYRWRAEVVPYEFSNQSTLLDSRVMPRLIRVTVSWGDRDSQEVTLTTIRLVEERR